jgi:hypothetical protein
MRDEPNGNVLSPALMRATELLREAPDPGDLWRHRLLKAVADQPIVVPQPQAATRWSMRPVAAVAAALLCVVSGAAGAWLLLGERPVPTGTPAVGQVVAGAGRVRFTLDAPGAHTVALVGDFNAWNPSGLQLHRLGDGRTWIVDVPLVPGRYSYSFVVDGALAPDPKAPRAAEDDFGSPSSVVLVSGS